MVFGFGEGNINIFLNKTTFTFGETIEGKLQLTLKKEKSARMLRASIVAEKQTTQYRTPMGNAASRGSNTIVLFKTDAILDGEKVYAPPGGEYPFKLQVPTQGALPPEIQGTLGTALKALQFLGGQTSQVKWFVEAVLDIPNGIDVRKRVQISIQ